MKYGVLSYERKALSLNGRDAQNMGDWVQTIAMEQLLRRMGVSDYLFISRNDAAGYTGENVRLIVNGYHSLFPRIGYKTETFPLSAQIEPIFLSMHFHDRCIPEAVRKQWIAYGPVGCRDEETCKNLRENGVPAYISGCVTALLPKRTPDPKRQTEVIIVDAAEELLEYMPKQLREKAEYKTQLFPIKRTSCSPVMTPEESIESYERAKELLEYYKDNAALVVTSRLHVASPCMAMGIPVVLAKEDFDGRYAWIDRFLPLYGKCDWGTIDWNPQPIDYEEEKNRLFEEWKKRILQFGEKTEVDNFSETFYMNRERYRYNRLISEALEGLAASVANGGKKVRYALWGVTEHALRVNNVIKDQLPDWELSGVFDLNVRGAFEGVAIKTPDEIEANDDVVYLVIAPRAWEFAKKKLEEMELAYVLVDVNSEVWTWDVPRR